MGTGAGRAARWPRAAAISSVTLGASPLAGVTLQHQFSFSPLSPTTQPTVGSSCYCYCCNRPTPDEQLPVPVR